MKKTIIAASLTALAMGPGFVGASEHAVEGQPITVDGKGDLSPNSEMKLIGGWHYDKNTEKNDLDHSASNTNITLTGGTFDELIGGNHIKQPRPVTTTLRLATLTSLCRGKAPSPILLAAARPTIRTTPT